MKAILLIGLLLLVGCNQLECEEVEINIIAELEQDYKETNIIIESEFCCNLITKECNNCITDKGAIWLWGMLDNSTGANVDVEYVRCIK